jgi:group I intron endonuclease
MGFIYKITNQVNGKVYVGKTEFSVEVRWKQHIADSVKTRCKDRPLYRAMNKYGLSSFSIEVLEETDKTEERELYWINLLQSYSKGYNATKGGDGKRYIDYSLVKEQYEVSKTAVKTAEVLGIDKGHTLKILKALGVNVKSAAVLIKENKSKKVLCKELQIVFESTKEAAAFVKEKHNLPSSENDIRSMIARCCRKQRKIACNYSWEYV